MSERLVNHEARELPDSVPLIAVVGQVSSGKGIVAEILQSKFGFHHYPISRVPQDYAKEMGIQVNSRDDLIRVKDEMIEKFGRGVFAQRTLDKITNDYFRAIQGGETYHGAILDGFRPLESTLLFKAQPHALLIGVDSNREVRFGRFVKRQKPGDVISREYFTTLEDREGSEIEQILRIADVVFTNDGTKEEFEEKVESYLTGILGTNPQEPQAP